MSSFPRDLEKSDTIESTPSAGENLKENDVQIDSEALYDQDGEALGLGKDGTVVPKEHVRIGLRQRHIQMIALAGAVGTGLFLGSGQALATAGPVGLLLAYISVASIVVGTVLSLAEMATLVPISGSYVRHAALYFDPALSFTAGWNIVYSNVVSVPAELVASAVLFQFWTDVSPAVFISVLIILLILTNAFTVRVYGEMEFMIAMIEILTIIGLILFGICIDLGAGPDGDRIGFRYWRDPGPFKEDIVTGNTGKFVGFWVALGNAAYAFASTETVAMAAAETKNPRRAIPRAAKSIFIRLFIFYIVAIFVVGLIVPSNDEGILNDSHTASASPFVIAANRAGVKVLPHILNAVVIISAWSAGNSGVLSSSRALYGMALDGNAPKVFARVHRWGVPYVGVALIILFTPLAYMTLGSSATKVFSWLQSLVSSITLIIWCTILSTYLRFYKGMKVQGIPRDDLPYKAPFQPYLALFALVFCVIVLLTGGFTTFMKGQWDTQTFFSAYFSIPLFLVAFFVYKIARGTKMVPYQQMRIREFVDFAKNHPEPPAEKKTGPLGWVSTILWG